VVVGAHAAAFAALTWWSWRKWPDPVIDFGRELYVPWAITRGAVLYRDIASLFGPLSPYVNALWFSLFGDSLRTLALCNLAILAAMTAGIHQLVLAAADRVTATAASLSVLFLFGFSQYIDVGNYNFVAPYSHEATHGLALSVAMLWCLYKASMTGRAAFDGLAGLCFGLVLLTKPDLALAASAAVATAWLGAALIGNDQRGGLARAVPLFLLSAAMPPLLFFGYFTTQMSAGDALKTIGGAWISASIPEITGNAFYRRGMGLDRPLANGLRVVQTFAVMAIFYAAVAIVCWARPGAPPSSRIKRLQQIAVLAIGILLAQTGAFPQALPLVCASAVILASASFLRARADRDAVRRSLLPVVCSVFALVLLGKLGLNSRIVHYGFYLALPATVVAIVATCWALPQFVAARTATPLAGVACRQIALCMVAAAITPYLAQSYAWYRSRVVTVGSGADRFFASNAPGLWHGAALQEAFQYLDGRVPAGARIAVLPEGVMLNYLLRRESALRVINVMPPEVLAFGEDAVLRSLEAAPPAFVVLIHRDVREYGYPDFGLEARYGRRTMEWIRSRYRVVRGMGKDPVDPMHDAIQILERAPSSGSPLTPRYQSTVRLKPSSKDTSGS